jgi:hypothetical protein
MSSSEDPIAAKPISCENCANVGSASKGTCPSNSWQQSLKIYEATILNHYLKC